MDFAGDGSNIQTIQWYFTEPGAKPLGRPTVFASGNWAQEKADWNGPGEVLGADRPWVNGKNYTLADGTSPACGNPDLWMAGVPTDLDVVLGVDAGPACLLHCYAPIATRLKAFGIYIESGVFESMAAVLVSSDGSKAIFDLYPVNDLSQPSFLQVVYQLPDYPSQGGVPAAYLITRDFGTIWMTTISFDPLGSGDWGTFNYPGVFVIFPGGTTYLDLTLYFTSACP